MSKEKKEKRPRWFTLTLESKTVMDQLSDEDLGKTMRALMSYFQDKTAPKLNGDAGFAFRVLKNHVDEAFTEYEKRQRDGRYGADVLHGREPPPGSP